VRAGGRRGEGAGATGCGDAIDVVVAGVAAVATVPAGKRHAAGVECGGGRPARRSYQDWRHRVLQNRCQGLAGVQLNSVPQAGQACCSAVTGCLPPGLRRLCGGVGAGLVGAHPVGAAVDGDDDAAAQEAVQGGGGEHGAAEPLGGLWSGGQDEGELVPEW
jgi:hypothetical protein